MLELFLEAMLALSAFLFIIWWTMFSGRKGGEPRRDDEGKDEDKGENKSKGP